MKKWFIHWKFELSFLFKNWLLLPMPILFLLWLVTSMTIENVSGSDNLYLSAYRTTHSTIFILVVGLSILIGVYLMRRDIGNDSFEWHLALPVSNFVFLSTKFVAGMTYLSLFTILMGIVFSTLSVIQGIPGVVTTHVLSFFVVQYEVSLLISLSLGIVLSVIIRNRFVYLIAFCAWVFGTLFMEIYILNGTGNFYFKPFHLTYLFMDSILANGVWGIEIMKDEIKWQRLFVLSFSFMLLMVTMLVLNSKRPNEHVKLWKVVCSISLLGAIFAYLPYSQLWNERLSTFDNMKESSPTFALSEDDRSPYMWFPPIDHESFPIKERDVYEPGLFSITNFDIDLKQTSNSNLDITANVTLQHEELESKDELQFTLNRTFSLKEVKIDQKSISYKQNGDFVTLTLPNNIKDPTIQFIYSGVYKLWTHRVGQEYYPAFSLNNQVVMPSHTAWYPLPGHQYLMDSTGESRTDVGLLHPSEFKVKVSGIANTVYGSVKNVQSSGENHTLSGTTARLDLFSGFLSEIKSKHYPTTLITVPYRREDSEKFMEKVDRRLTYFEEFLDDEIEPVHHLFFLPLDQLRWSGYFRQRGFIDQNYIMNENNIINQRETINNFVIANLFHEDNFVSGYDRPKNLLITSTIKASFNYVYELEHGKEEDAFQTRSRYANIPDQYDKNDFSKELIQIDKLLDMIEDAVHAGKEEKVKEVLNRLYSNHWSDNSYPTGYDLYLEPVALISFEDWMKEWNDVMKPEE
ncbi:ABC transporter permease [Alkalihalobacillus sp. R86527]|uniref:ABC transporter permease n=1 Tax=Alkalihalobacillus sp. R86527 TaxID=3093863 RepID=UPI00366E20FB